MHNLQIIYSDRKSISLQIDQHGVKLRVPNKTKKFVIDKILTEKKDWIDSKQERITKKLNLQSDLFINSKNIIWFFGKSYILQRHNTSNCILNDKIILNENNTLSFFYKSELGKYVQKKLVSYSNTLGLQPKKISVKEMKSRWGSCSTQGNISFNINLSKAPKFVIDYVVIHELLHLKEMNHSKRFWNLVSINYPDYEQAITWLKNYGRNLM